MQESTPEARWGRPLGPTVQRNEEERREHAKELRHGQYERRRLSELTTLQLLQRLGAELAAKKEVRGVMDTRARSGNAVRRGVHPQERVVWDPGTRPPHVLPGPHWCRSAALQFRPSPGPVFVHHSHWSRFGACNQPYEGGPGLGEGPRPALPCFWPSTDRRGGVQPPAALLSFFSRRVSARLSARVSPSTLCRRACCPR